MHFLRFDFRPRPSPPAQWCRARVGIAIHACRSLVVKDEHGGLLADFEKPVALTLDNPVFDCRAVAGHAPAGAADSRLNASGGGALYGRVAGAIPRPEPAAADERRRAHASVPAGQRDGDAAGRFQSPGQGALARGLPWAVKPNIADRPCPAGPDGHLPSRRLGITQGAAGIAMNGVREARRLHPTRSSAAAPTAHHPAVARSPTRWRQCGKATRCICRLAGADRSRRWLALAQLPRATTAATAPVKWLRLFDRKITRNPDSRRLPA